MPHIATSAANEITKALLKSPGGLQEFGRMLLACCVTDRELFSKVAPCVNFNDKTGEFDQNDFVDNIPGLLFGAMQEFQSTYVEGNPWPNGQAEWAQAVLPHINLFLAKNPEYPKAYLREAMTALLLLPPPKMGDHDRVCDGVVDYVLGVRYDKLSPKLENADPASVRVLLEEVPRSIRPPGSKVLIQSKAEQLASWRAAPKPARPFATGISNFDTLFASQALAADSWLVSGHTGGGKTNFACQTAVATAALGHNVAYFTTEITAQILYYRMFSSALEVNFSEALKMQGCYGTHEHDAAFERWFVEGCGRRIEIFDWRELPGVGYKDMINRAMDAFCVKHGGPPYLVLYDWIGKALDEGYDTAWAKREAYNGVAAHMTDVAYNIQGVTITLAQGSKESENRSTIIASDTQDSKSLADGKSGFAGITSLRDTSDAVAGETAIFRETQFLCVGKCRNVEAKRIPVRRAFHNCKFLSGH